MKFSREEIVLMTAYGLGYWHGRESGCEANPYDPEDYPKQTQAYRLGYDAGVADYCHDMHLEDENV